MEGQPQAAPQGAGSIWNVNSWHWENKNYTEVAKQVIEAKLSQWNFKKDDLKIIITKVTKVKGDAQINIRKGKQIMCYELDIDVEWTAENDNDIADGTLTIRDLNESELDFEVTNISVNEKTAISDRAKEIVRKHAKAELSKVFSTFNEDLAKVESDPKKLAEDKQKREEAYAAMLKARSEKGEEKERLLEQQREKERAMKHEFVSEPKK